MARFGIVGPSYTSQSLTADAQMTKNWYVEQLENPNGKSGFALYPTPGLNIFCAVGGFPVRGLHTVSGRTFAVSGTDLFEILANGSFLIRGTVANDGKPASMTGSMINPTAGTPQLAFISAGILYVFDLLGNVLYTPAGALGTPFQIVYADGFYVMLNTNGVFQFSAPLDATNWPGINAASVSIYPDVTLAMVQNHRELWFFSGNNGAVYTDTGASPVPYEPVSGGDMEQGIAAPWSALTLDNTIFWLGSRAKDGAGMVWRASGYTPMRVSNHAIEFAMQGYSKISDAIAYGYQDQGHTFYVLYFPTADATWVLDVATGMWHERGFWNSAIGQFNAHRSRNHTFNFGKHLVGDWLTGTIFEMNIKITQDVGNEIRRVRRSPHISNENEWTYFEQLIIDLETGLTPSQLLPGQAPPTFFTLADSTSGLWNMGITDIGALTTNAAGGAPGTLYINDASGGSWQIIVSTIGVLQTIPAPTNDYPTSYLMYSNTGQSQWVLLITTLGILQTSFAATVYRNPTLMLRWSNDYGHTWSNIHTADTGNPGNYKARVRFSRMGRARDRVYEITVSDPIPWRIDDAYLQASPGYAPTERLTDKLRKGA